MTKEPIIVTRISGGLGNQMFQYAAGLAAAKRTGARLKLDMTWYGEELREDRRFSLRHFNIDAPFAEQDDLQRVSCNRLEQDMTVFDKRIFDCSGDCHLLGYWVGASYFAGAENEVRRHLAFANPLVADYATKYVERARKLGEGGPVVGMHVRRGDNTRAANFNRFQVHPNAFYEQASAGFPPGSVFVVFSDSSLDLEWCEANLPRRKDCAYIFSDGHSWLFDFAIMIACDHLIKSMSTFSWWAAWLNQAPGRQVICPHPIQGIGPLYAHVRQDEYVQPGWRVIDLPSVL
jgi:hypothetical protein